MRWLGAFFLGVALAAVQSGRPALAGEETQLAMLEPLALLPSEAAPEAAAIGADMLAGRKIVAMPAAFPAGDILVVNRERRLYLSLGEGRALVYPVAIGKPGRTFSGVVRVTRMARNPGWTPTPNIRREHPDLPAYVPPGPNNPLGPRALYLGEGYYRIHGTNKPRSIGKAASNGCIRMHNRDVVHLFDLVKPGARVVILEKARGPGLRRRGPRRSSPILPAVAPRPFGFSGAAPFRLRRLLPRCRAPRRRPRRLPPAWRGADSC
jgi:lipoprotein-anchoring transpeptidase ErfK/SrfK